MEVEQLPDEGREQLVRRHRPEAADRVAADAVGAGRPDVDRDRLEGERMADAEHHVAASAHGVGVGDPVEGGGDVARGHVARAQPGGRGDDPRHADAVRPQVGKRRLQLPRERVVVRRRLIGAFDHGDR